MKPFVIKEIQTENRKSMIVFSTSYISPLKYIEEIETELRDKNVSKQKIFFDFFLSNKNSQERYAVVEFNGLTFDKKSFQYINIDKKHCFRRISVDFYNEEKDSLDFTFLTSIQKKMIFRGVAI